jgi:hypothetical protein
MTQYEWNVETKPNGFKSWERKDKALFLLIVIPLVLIWISTVIKIISWII